MANLSDSAIAIEVNNSRALAVQDNAPGIKGFHRDQDGVLWAAFVAQQKILDGYADVGVLDIYKSSDNGFTWALVTSLGVDHVEEGTYYGAPVFMFDDRLGKLWIMRSDSNGAMQMNSVTKSTGATTNYAYYGDNFAPDWSPFEQDFKLGQFTMCGDANSITWSFARSSVSDSLVAIPWDFGFAHPRPRVSETLSIINWTGAFDCVDASGLVHVIGQDLDTAIVKSCTLTKQGISGSFALSKTIEDTSPQFAFDMSIDKDGHNIVIASYATANAANTSGDIRIAGSSDDAATWGTPEIIYKPTGTSMYTDKATGNISLRSRLIANNEGGFMLSAIFKEDTTNNPQLYVNEFKTYDSGVNYSSPSGWLKVNSRPDQSIIGGEFFRPMNTHTMYFGNKADMRMAYLVGEGTGLGLALYGDDTVKSAVFQERLNTNAYPDPINQITITQKNVDFHSSGFIGTNTTLYSGVFDTHATSGHFVQHEPVSGANVTGESAYVQEAEYTTDIFFDTISYDRPQVESEATLSQVKAVERDIRKIFLRPNFYLSRTFLVNDGGFLKRTVWILEHFGNRYEISQVVPKFIENQICYYEANAFVVGPSNDPFSRVVLPSET